MRAFLARGEDDMGGPSVEERIQWLLGQITPAFVEAEVGALMRQGEDVGGGVNALRLVRHLLGDAAPSDVSVAGAYEQFKPALREALQQLPELYFFEGD
jgi:hypothetical protein